MGHPIDGMGCEICLLVDEARFEDARFLELLDWCFGLGEDDFEPSALGDGSGRWLKVSSEGKAWEQGELARGCEAVLPEFFAMCEDGSCFQFIDMEECEWKMFGKQDGKAIAGSQPIECPLTFDHCD